MIHAFSVSRYKIQVTCYFYISNRILLIIKAYTQFTILSIHNKYIILLLYIIILFINIYKVIIILNNRISQ